MRNAPKEPVRINCARAVDDSERCTNCGICVSRCVFRAKMMVEGGLAYDPTKCFGCGLCISTCPANAITLASKS